MELKRNVKNLRDLTEKKEENSKRNRRKLTVRKDQKIELKNNTKKKKKTKVKTKELKKECN